MPDTLFTAHTHFPRGTLMTIGGVRYQFEDDLVTRATAELTISYLKVATNYVADESDEQALAAQIKSAEAAITALQLAGGGGGSTFEVVTELDDFDVSEAHAGKVVLLGSDDEAITITFTPGLPVGTTITFVCLTTGGVDFTNHEDSTLVVKNSHFLIAATGGVIVARVIAVAGDTNTWSISGDTGAP